MAKKKKKDKINGEGKAFIDNVWEDFAKTGAVGSYLLYKSLKDGWD